MTKYGAVHFTICFHLSATDQGLRPWGKPCSFACLAGQAVALFYCEVLMETRHNTNLINRRIIIQLQALNPEADKQSMYELCKAYVRSKKPTAQQYELAIKFIADWLEV